MTLKKDILIGIVTYNPDIERLDESLRSITGHNCPIVIFDNDSINSDKIATFIDANYKDVILKKNSKNLGLGIAYNFLLDFAINNGFKWLLLLDQDSVCDKGLISMYRKYIETDNNVGMYTCLITDRNSANGFQNKIIGDYVDVERCISAGSLMRTSLYLEGIKYDPVFFIDKLDYDICYMIREHGFLIRQINYKGVLQEVGKSEDHKLFFKNITVYNHSPMRRYYMARNGIFLSRKHKERKMIKSLVKETFDILCVILYEKDKVQKVKAFSKGIKDGLSMENI